MKAIFLTILLSFMTQALAGASSTEIRRFCEEREDSQYVKDLTKDFHNLLAFANHGGIINGGVCWWHSRFQRNALYLALYAENLPKPSSEEARAIIKKLIVGKSVVTIPGFSNLFDFSREYYTDIQHALEIWQKKDSLAFTWIRGLRGKNVVSPEKLKEIMDQTYKEVEIQGNIVYQKLQIKGIMAHAWLVVHMNKVKTGYNLYVIDSNYPMTISQRRYENNSVALYAYEYGYFTPYIERDEELVHIKNAITQTCSNVKKVSKD